MGNDISMDPVIVKEEMKAFNDEFRQFQELTEAFFKSFDKLGSWKSTNKNKLDAEVSQLKPNFGDLEQVIESYYKVGVLSANRLESAESKISKSFYA